MDEQHIRIGHIPAVIYGSESEKVYIFIHGKCGRKEEAGSFAKLAYPAGFQVISVDLPGHGERQGEKNTFYPWIAAPELNTVMEYAKTRWKHISLRATSIGAWFSVLAFQNEAIEKCLFVSPVLDMEKLIENMMLWAGVTSKELERREEIETDFGETLSWKYYQFAKENKIQRWPFPTEILYAEKDNLTDFETVKGFSEKFGCSYTVMQNGEHWFHTEEQLAFLRQWEKKNLVIGLTATVKVDRPLGSSHPDFPEILYAVNYGYIEGVIAPDGEDQDAYILGVNEPVSEFTGKIIAIIIGNDDIEEKWVIAPENKNFTEQQIMQQLRFQEKYFDSKVLM